MRSAAAIISLCGLVLLLTKPTTCTEPPKDSNGDGSSFSGTPRPPFPDPEMLLHLKQLFLGAKQLGRPLVNGEMNLLPDKTKGFANSVRCFSDMSGTSMIVDNYRTLQFNLSSISTSDTIMAVDLVLKQPPSTPSYRTQLHEIVGDGPGLDHDLKLLDSGDWEGEWHTLHVENMVDAVDNTNRRRDYRLALSLSSIEGKSPQGRDLLNIMKPMLLVYTNGLNQTSESLGTRSPPSLGRNKMAAGGRDKEMRSQKTGSVRRRRDTGSSSFVTEESLDTLGQLPCQKHARSMSFSDLGWPGDLNAVVIPSVAHFSFCHGRCNLHSHPLYKNQYTNHARVMNIARPDLVAAGIAPCCVPVEYNPVAVTYSNIYTNIVTMTSLPDITSCQCL